MRNEDISAAPRLLRIPGANKAYRISPLTDADIDELNCYVRKIFVERATEALPDTLKPDDRRVMLGSIAEQSASLTFMSGRGAALLIHSIEGLARVLWQGIKAHHPDVTVEQIAKDLHSGDKLANVREANATMYEAQGLEYPSGKGSGRKGQPQVFRPARSKHRAAKRKPRR